jgi:hypothetical protein
MFSRLCMAVAIAAPCTLLSAPLQKWIYCGANLLVDAEVEHVEKLLRRGAAAGYDHMVIADSKFNRLHEMPEKYFAHLKAVQALATELHIEIVPTVLSMGYSNDFLGADPNLAEGLPVKDALFVVKNGQAHAVTEAPATLRNGDFSDASRKNGWNVLDDCVRIEDGAVHMKDPGGKNSRITQNLELKPFHVYHLTMRVKSKDFSEKPEAKVLTKGRQLNYAFLGAKQTQDWTTHHVIFNSLDNTSATLYLGAWGAQRGELWFDDVTLQEAGLVNLLRRPGCPFEIKTEDGVVLKEGKDYESVQDKDMGVHPYAGCYDVWHEPPSIKTKLPDGTRLRVSFYHPMSIYDEQMCACPSEPQTLQLLRRQARQVNDAMHPTSFMMSHDEWRVMNWCEACQKRKLDAGAMIALNAEDCTGFLKSTAPTAKIYVWNDMFDPHHNAQKSYYLVRGDLTGSWEGLSKDVVIMNWNLDKLKESLAFFSGRGHQQIIAGYYDSDVNKLKAHLTTTKDVRGVVGVMYTTWQRKYEDLEAFARIADQFTATP